MTKLESIEHKIFASEAPLDEIGQFGSALDTTKLNTKDVTTIQALPAYTKGWGSAVISDSNYPTMEEMNGVLNVMSYHTGYLYQEGIPVWRNDREYSATSIVKEPTGTKLFHSLKDGNIGNALDNTEYWEELKLGGSGLEVCDIGMALYVDETKGLRRYLNGQIVDINTNTQAFLNRLLQIQTTNPEYFATEENWQAESLLNIDGCVYKFVLNYADDGETVVSVRLPKYPDYVEINNISSSAPVSVYGNGYSLGLTDGDYNFGIAPTRNTENTWMFHTNDYYIKLPSYGGTTSSNISRAGYRLGVTTDPTKSGLIGTAYFSNNQTKLKLRYFIQIATGSETENNIINEIELNNPYSLFDSKYSDHELNNLSWLKSEGQWNAKAVYPTAYDKLLKVYNGTESVEGLSVKLSTETYTDYDFVLNTADETFRLPLKNHTADDGNSVLTLYFYVGETVQNANLIDAGRIGEQLATKTDMLQASGAGMPSNRYIDLTLGASGSTYTAPANGWVLIGKRCTANQYLGTYANSIMRRMEVWNSNYCSLFFPVRKGDIFPISYTADGQTEVFRFVYAEGSK